MSETRLAPVRIWDPALVTSHPELHHYTRFEGLRGIVESNTLRATYFKNLNDASEITLLRVPLIEALTRRYVELLRERQRQSLKLKRTVERIGGLHGGAAKIASIMVDALYATFDKPEDLIYSEAFITSFCTHDGKSYEREHGLLSQWRGYGGDGGFCLVFDAAALTDNLCAEFDGNYYVDLNLNIAVYADEKASVESAFPTLLKIYDDFLSAFLDDNNPEGPLNAALSPFISGATHYKHQGFREESEIRIVAMPGSRKKAQLVRAEHGHQVGNLKSVLLDEKGRRYITLFEKIGRPLPITRIIVGPSTHQDANFERAQSIARSIPVTKSETPFIG